MTNQISKLIAHIMETLEEPEVDNEVMNEDEDITSVEETQIELENYYQQSTNLDLDKLHNYGDTSRSQTDIFNDINGDQEHSSLRSHQSKQKYNENINDRVHELSEQTQNLIQKNGYNETFGGKQIQENNLDQLFGSENEIKHRSITSNYLHGQTLTDEEDNFTDKSYEVPIGESSIDYIFQKPESSNRERLDSDND